MKKLTKIMLTVILLVIPMVAHAEIRNMDHSKMNHGEMTQKSIVMGIGKVNSIDAENNIINITHEPIPALKWPAMTMDLPVTKKVELSKIKAGDSVNFHIKLGHDKIYRITKITQTGHGDYKKMKKINHGKMDHKHMGH